MAKLQRPDIYVPLSVRFHTGKTGTALRARFGRDGALVWACYLTACKLNPVPGEISYASEAEGWARLGLEDDPPSFTLAEFFAATGKLRKTKKQRSGKVTYVKCQVWSRWTSAQKQETERERKARKRAQSTRDNRRTRGGTKNGQAPDTPRTTSGHEADLETDELRKPSRAETVGTTEGSSLDSVKGRSKRSAPPNSLPPEKEHQLQRLLKAAGQDADEGTAHVFASFVGELPEVSVARAVESLASANGVRNRAKYLAGALKSESERLGKDEDDDSIPF